MHPTGDEKRRAFAVLELSPEANPGEIRRAYLRLVRRWHPDRFANDPQGRVEATDRLRAILAAYETLSNGAPPPPTPRYRWTREGIGEKPAFQVFARFLFWAWPLFVAYFISRPRSVRLDDLIQGNAPSRIPYLQAALLALSAALFLWQRRRRS